jgi:16S rRNA processing protein RimM
MKEVPPGYVAVGRVSTAWGTRGVVKVIPLVDKRERLAPGRSVTVAGQRRTIESSRWQKGLAHLKLSGIDDRAAALALRGQLLTVPESELEPLGEGEYYRFQLVGLAVRSTAGASLGRVTDVLSTGANDVYVVQGERGEILVPATDDIVKEIDLERGRIVIEEVPGLTPDAGKKG